MCCTNFGALDPAVLGIDFRYLTNKDDRNPTTWVQTSSSTQFQNRLIWVGGNSTIAAQVRDLARSRHIIAKYDARRQSLSQDKQRLLFEEQSRSDKLEAIRSNRRANYPTIIKLEWTRS